MPLFLHFPHVAGMCSEACIAVDKIDGFAPHREAPEEITVVYSGQQHFWVSLPFPEFLKKVDQAVRNAKGSPQVAKIDTNPVSDRVLLLVERRHRREQRPPSRGPSRYDPDTRY